MECSYCSKKIKEGSGIMYVYRTGAIKYFCSGRCYKNNILIKRKINSKLVARRLKHHS
ncbi:MAG: hypothetical protein QXN59_00900 [Candidatus Micrarchaeaceae archaeon]